MSNATVPNHCAALVSAVDKKFESDALSQTFGRPRLSIMGELFDGHAMSTLLQEPSPQHLLTRMARYRPEEVTNVCAQREE